MSINLKACASIVNHHDCWVISLDWIAKSYQFYSAQNGSKIQPIIKKMKLTRECIYAKLAPQEPFLYCQK